MSFFGGYSKRGRQLEEQDKKFLEFKKQMISLIIMAMDMAKGKMEFYS